MKFFSFLSSFASKKADKAGDSIAGFIVRFDPDTASEAQKAQFEKDLNRLVEQAAQFRVDYDRENKESVAIKEKYDNLMAAAENLQSRLEAAPENEKEGLQASLGNLLAEIEDMAPDVDREREEAETALVFLKEFEAAAEEAAKKLASANKQLERARKEMASSELARERADRQAENAAALAGLRSKTDSMGVALGAMQDEINANRQAADAAKHKAELLSKNAPKDLAKDPNIAAALAATSGAKPATTLTERLAALKNRTATVAA